MTTTRQHKCNKEVELAEMSKDIKQIIALLGSNDTGMVGEVKKNTEFRIQAKGIIGMISFISAALGGMIMFLAGKLWK